MSIQRKAKLKTLLELERLIGQKVQALAKIATGPRPATLVDAMAARDIGRDAEETLLLAVVTNRQLLQDSLELARKIEAQEPIGWYVPAPMGDPNEMDGYYMESREEAGNRATAFAEKEGEKSWKIFPMVLLDPETIFIDEGPAA
jgi:hypothetical protein